VTAKRSRAPSNRHGRDVREDILRAFDALLREQPFAELAVADVLSRAGVSRASFYFYFASKYEVLGELLDRATSIGVDTAQPWLATAGEDPEPAVRFGIEAGAVLWQTHAHLLRAVVEHWREDDGLRQLWAQLMQRYTDLTAEKIEADRRAGRNRPDVGDPRHLAAALTWLGERLYYLAAIGLQPFHDNDVLVDTLTTVWMHVLYDHDAETAG
jgi:AcrR family transcriptional regulator